MAGVALKIQRFFGEAPKISGELLPNTVAQYAFNLDLSSGDLLPYRRSERIAKLDKDGTFRTIYPMEDPDTGEKKWLHWTTDVDVATAQVEGDQTQRIYYTGEDYPRVTDYALATSGVRFPSQSYKMGLPLPTAVPVVVATPFTQKNSASRSRDAGNNATIVTGTAHGLSTGDYATVTSFTDTLYNLSNVRVTVVDDVTFSYFNFGAAEATAADTTGRVDLAGLTQPRNYIFTYITAWDEESVPSTPSEVVFIKEGQALTISGLPTLWSHGTGYQEAGLKLRVYRTVAGVAGTDYFRVAELDVQPSVAGDYTRAAGTDLVSVTAVAHGMQTGYTAKITVTDGSGLTGATVTVTRTGADTFTFDDASLAVPSAGLAIAGGLSYAIQPAAGTYSRPAGSANVTVTKQAHGYITGDYVSARATDSSALVASTAKVTKINDDSFSYTDASVADAAKALLISGAVELLRAQSFIDDLDVALLDNLLESADYDAPDVRMQGILAIHNSMIVGFFDNTICFSEPGVPHAWPIKYRAQVDSKIVALGAYGTTLLALTDRTPWKLDGNNPAAMSITRTDYILPCVSKRSVINIGFGVVWASAGGLAVYSTTIGTDYLTKNVHSWSTWPKKYDAENLYGAYYRGRYFGSDGLNTFMFERDEAVGGHLVQTDVRFTAAYYDAKTDSFFYAAGDQVWLWNSPLVGNATLDWKSKVFTTKSPINIGAAQIVGDFNSEEDAAALVLENTNIRVYNGELIESGTVTGVLGTQMGNELQVGGSNLREIRVSVGAVTFQFFVNKQLIYSSSRGTAEAFRLPSGYRADVFEVRVATNVRVRAIMMAESMAGLRGA
tara:strand:+ start:5483 stop:7993 length:2511 start_codon:yes stop_codon:yes gene_type:complete